MTDRIAFTELEEGLFGPDGTTVLRSTASRLIALREDMSAQIDAGLTPDETVRFRLATEALDAAERILIQTKPSGE